MKVVIITCFESNEERVRFVIDACKKRGDDVVAITSDFSHIRKEKRNNVPTDYIAIPTMPYSRNMSIRRMISHYRFAVDAFARVKEEKPDLIWLMAPANSLIKEAKKYKKENEEVKLIIDIIDMWPESLPVRINKDILPFKIWKNIRKNSIGCCDLLVSECDLYQKILKEEYRGEIRTIHWARDNKADTIKPEISDDELVLVYIGSINNIIDDQKIAKMISEINKPVILHVIGEGESTQTFLDTLNSVCKLVYHGAIRDNANKAEIFRKCHAGINIYKDGLYIGLTVKCIDYFNYGLPIINNIKGDTWQLVNKYNAGINYDEETVIDAERLIEMRKNNDNIIRLYNDCFTKEVFMEKCLEAIDEVMQ